MSQIDKSLEALAYQLYLQAKYLAEAEKRMPIRERIEIRERWIKRKKIRIEAIKAAIKAIERAVEELRKLRNKRVEFVWGDGVGIYPCKYNAKYGYICDYDRKSRIVVDEFIDVSDEDVREEAIDILIKTKSMDEKFDRCGLLSCVIDKEEGISTLLRIKERLNEEIKKVEEEIKQLEKEVEELRLQLHAKQT